MDAHEHDSVTCIRCGKCCLTDLIAYVTKEKQLQRNLDFDRENHNR